MCQQLLGCIEISKISDRKLKDCDLKQELRIGKPPSPRGDGAKEVAEQISHEDVREKREVRAQWEKCGQRGGVRQGGERHRRKQARKDEEEELQELLAWIRAALVEGVGKVQDPKVQAAVAKKVEDAKVKEMRKDPDFMSSARCELWFALDAASLEVIGLAAKAGCCGEKVALMWLAARPDWLAPN